MQAAMNSLLRKLFALCTIRILNNPIHKEVIMRAHFTLAILLIVGGALFLGAGKVSSQESTGDKTQPATVEMCAKCHQHQANLFKMEPHSPLDTEGLASMVDAEFGCAACHLDVGTVSTFQGGISDFAKSQGCLATFALGKPCRRP